VRLSLDSNLLVYAADIDAGQRHRQSLEIVDRALLADCVLALQCLAEFFYATTRKQKLTLSEAARFVADWRGAVPVHAATMEALADAIEAHRRHRLPFWDAMLWATVQQAGCSMLLTEDFQDRRRLGAVTFVNPFDPANAALLDRALAPDAK
jgi:predicted nucleic acid-binding protein